MKNPLILDSLATFTSNASRSPCDISIHNGDHKIFQSPAEISELLSTKNDNGHSRDRILIVDDNQSIHNDFKKILAPDTHSKNFDELEASLFGEAAPENPLPQFLLDSAFQGQEALEMVNAARREGRP